MVWQAGESELIYSENFYDVVSKVRNCNKTFEMF